MDYFYKAPGEVDSNIINEIIDIHKLSYPGYQTVDGLSHLSDNISNAEYIGYAMDGTVFQCCIVLKNQTASILADYATASGSDLTGALEMGYVCMTNDFREVPYSAENTTVITTLVQGLLDLSTGKKVFTLCRTGQDYTSIVIAKAASLINSYVISNDDYGILTSTPVDHYEWQL